MDDYISAIAVDAATTTTTIYVGSLPGGVFKSTDGGDTWRSLATGLGNPDVGFPTVHGLLPDSAPSGRLYAATDGGVFVIEQASTCAGDCNVDRDIAIAELLTLVNIGLGSTSVVECGSGDTNGDGRITIDEIIQAVNVALVGCSGRGGTAVI